MPAIAAEALPGAASALWPDADVSPAGNIKPAPDKRPAFFKNDLLELRYCCSFLLSEFSDMVIVVVCSGSGYVLVTENVVLRRKELKYVIAHLSACH